MDGENGTRLICGKYGLYVPAELAAEIGLAEAMIAQQIHYWCKASGVFPVKEHEGNRWVRIPNRALAKQFPFWCLGVVQRALDHLRTWGLVHTATFNESKFDKGLWYAIDYERISHHEDIQPQKRKAPHERQVDSTMESSMIHDGVDSTIESSRLHDEIIDDSTAGSKPDSMVESTPDSMVESSFNKTILKIKKTEESVSAGAATPTSPKNGEGLEGEEETEEFSPNPPPPQPEPSTNRPHLPPPALTATYQCERCQKTLTAPPRELARTSWQQPTARVQPGETVASLCPDCQKSQAWQAGDRVTWLHESRNGYGYTIPVAGVVRSISAQRVKIAVVENGKVAFKDVKPEKLKARDQPIEREAELESAEAPVQPHVALILAASAAIPEAYRPPGGLPIEPNVVCAKLMLEDGFTPERVGAFVAGTYDSYLKWAAEHDAPPLMSLEHVRKYLKGWEAKQVKKTDKSSKPRTLPPPPFNWAKASAKPQEKGDSA